MLSIFILISMVRTADRLLANRVRLQTKSLPPLPPCPRPCSLLHNFTLPPVSHIDTMPQCYLDKELNAEQILQLILTRSLDHESITYDQAAHALIGGLSDRIRLDEGLLNGKIGISTSAERFWSSLV